MKKTNDSIFNYSIELTTLAHPFLKLSSEGSFVGFNEEKIDKTLDIGDNRGEHSLYITALGKNETHKR